MLTLIEQEVDAIIPTKIVGLGIVLSPPLRIQESRPPIPFVLTESGSILLHSRVKPNPSLGSKSERGSIFTSLTSSSRIRRKFYLIFNYFPL